MLHAGSNVPSAAVLIDVTDGTDTVTDADTLTFGGGDFDVTDGGGGDASVVLAATITTGHTWTASQSFSAILPRTDATYDAGSATFGWRDVYSTRQFLGGQGSVSLPTFARAFTGSSGMYFDGAEPSFTRSGVWVASFDGSGANYQLALTSTARIVWSTSGVGATGNSFDLALWRDAAATFAIRNSTTAQSARIYNTFTDASNYERGVCSWQGNVLVIGLEVAGTGANRAVNFVAGTYGAALQFDGAGGVKFNANFLAGTDNAYNIGALGATRPSSGFFGTSLTVGASQAVSIQHYSVGIRMGANQVFSWTGTNDQSGATVDLSLRRGAAGTLSQSNGVNAQAYYLYNTTDSDATPVNYERGELRWSSNTLELLTNAGGTGVTTRGVTLGTVGNGQISLSQAGSVRWAVNTSQHFVTGTGNAYDVATSATPARTGYFGTALVVGTNPADTGAIRLSNASVLRARNAANSANYDVVGLNGADVVEHGYGAVGHDIYTGTALALALRATTLTFADALNIVLNATTGTRIATSSLQKLSLWNATPVVQQVGGVTLTNNVTAGGTTNQLDDFTSLTVYATDAAAIRNNIYQLGRKLKLCIDALRTFGALQNADA